MIGVINTALSGLLSSSKQAQSAASNIANVTTAGALSAEDGPAPYNATTTTSASLAASQGGGVATNIVQKDPGFVQAYAPNSPFANEEGLIGVPNVSLEEEAINLKIAEITYKANASVLGVASDLNDELINTLDRHD